MYFLQCWKIAIAALCIGIVLAVESASLGERPGPQQLWPSFLSALKPGPQPINLKVWTDKGPQYAYRQGDRLSISLHADRDCYLAVIAASSDGKLKVLFPNEGRRDGKITKGKIYTFFGDESGTQLILGKRVARSELAFFVGSEPFRLYLPQRSTEQKGAGILVRSAVAMKLLRHGIAAMAESDDFNRVVLPLAGPDGENFEIDLIWLSEEKGPAGTRGLPSAIESSPPEMETGTQGVRTKLRE